MSKRLDRYIYVSGGFENSGDKVEFYDTQRDEQGWTELPSLQEARSRHAMCQLGETFLYVFGGENCETIGRLDVCNIAFQGWVPIRVSS